MTAQPEFDSTKSRIRIKLESFIDASHLNTLFVVFVCLFFKQGPWIPREMYKKKLKIRPGPILNSDWTRPPSKFQGQLGGFCETLLTNQLTNKTKLKKKTQVKKWPPWWRTGVYSPTRSYARHFNQLNTLYSTLFIKPEFGLFFLGYKATRWTPSKRTCSPCRYTNSLR